MTITETNRIRNLAAYLRSTEADVVIARTTIVDGGWHDIEFYAHAAGFDVYRFINHEYKARKEFAECYKFTRR